jgi:hypothetical protein
MDIDSEDFPMRTLGDDSQVITNEVRRLVEKEAKKVIVVMHTFGGLVRSNAIPEELSYAKPRQQGLIGRSASF